MNLRIVSTCVCSIVAVLGGSLSLLAAPVDLENGSASRFELYSTRDVVIAGSVEEIALDGSIALGGPEKARVPGEQVIALRRVGAPLPPWPGDEHLACTNGDRIPGKILRLRDERLRITAHLGRNQELSLGVASIAYLWFGSPRGVDDVPAYQIRLGREARRHDVVVLRNGDTLEGTLLALDDRTLRIECQGKTTELETQRVAVVAFNTELARVGKPRATLTRLTLTNGARLSLTEVTREAGALLGRTIGGSKLEIPFDQVVALDRCHGPAVYLSDLKPRRYEHTPFLGLSWSWHGDMTVALRPLCLKGNVYDRGIGMHSQSRLSYDLGGKYQRFECLVGLDEETGRRGQVQIYVLLDGKPAELGWDGTLRGAASPHLVRLSTAGARELTLAVDFGTGGDVQDHVNWVEARLVR